MARILLADDDEKLRETFAEALRIEGWDVLTANNGAVAQQVYDDAAANGDPPKVAILDCLMPKVAGFDVAKALRAKDPEIALVFVTGVFKSAAQQQDAREKFDCKAYLVKPVDLAKLVEAVKPLMAQHAAAAAQPADPLPAEGTLLEAPVAYLLWRAEREKHSGVLDVFAANERARVFVYKGRAVFGQTSDPMINIGIELIKDGVLTADAYRQVVEMCMARGAGLYDVLKSEGFATDQQMRPVYKRVVPQVVEKVAAMNGKFRWTATDEFSSIVPAATVPIRDALLAGIKKANEKDLAPHVEPRRPLRLAPGDRWDEVVPLLPKAAGSDSLARAINGRATIAQMIEAAPSPDERVARLKQVYLLMSTMAVQASMEPIKMERGHYVPPEQPVVAPAPRPSAPPQSSGATPVAPASRPTPAAPSAAVHAAAHASPSPSAGAGVAASGSNGLPRFSTTAAEDQAADRGVAFNAEEQAARQRIFAKAEELRAAKDLFQVLGVPKGADAATVKKAYLQLAREFHPDSFSGKNLGSAKRKLDELYAAITDANATLTDPRKRGEYDARSSIEEKGGSTDVAAIFQADADFQKGKLICERGDYAAALKLLDKAYSVVKDNEELTGYRAYCQWWATRDANQAGQVVQLLENCYAKVPIAHALKEFQGRIYMEIGNLQKAKASFKKVLEADPEHMGAQSAMRILNRKSEEDAKKAAQGGGLGGMLGKLGKR